jgi:phage terminase large subunit-like protein
MFRNVELKYDHNDNCKPYKSNKDENNKIDGVISSLEALGAFLHSNTFDPKIYVI